MVGGGRGGVGDGGWAPSAVTICSCFWHLARDELRVELIFCFWMVSESVFCFSFGLVFNCTRSGIPTRCKMQTSHQYVHE